MKRSSPRVGLLSSHPIQYYSPWFRSLANSLDLHVFYAHRQTAAEQAQAGFGVAFEWDIDLLAGYEYSFLENVSLRPNVYSFSGCDTPGIHREVAIGDFDAFIVTGWYLKSYWQGVRACRRYGVPVLVRGDSHLGTPRPFARRIAKEFAYRWMMSQFDGFLVVGQRNREYVMHYGAPADRCFSVPHFVDTAWFQSQARKADRNAVRSALGVGEEEKALLFVGRLIDVKMPLEFVRALGALRRRGMRFQGIVVGSGPLDDTIRREAASLDVPLHLLGFKNQSELPSIYAACDCLIIPSNETWGLVANEGAACGLPLVLSDAAGCAPDMVLEGQTGSRFPLGDVERCADAVERALAARQAPEFHRHVQAVLSRHSCEAAVEGTCLAVEHVRRSRRLSA